MSKKTRSKRTKQNFTKKKCCDVTFYGLHKWRNHVFEHLGWMVLAKEKHNNEEKILAYKKSIDNLLNSLENALKEIKESDRKRDIKIMNSELLILRSYVEELL